MPKLKSVQSKNAPAPIGPYSQAVESQGFIFTSGQIALDSETGQLVTGGVEAQARKVFDNLNAVLEAGGSALEFVVKTTIFLKNMDDFGKVNAIYAEYFSKALPARSTVEVSRLPKDVLVEVDCIAVKR
ncbi:MAG: RidA family protein [Calditrichaceae bacterium]